MTLNQLSLKKRSMLALYFICLFLCINVAQGANLNVFVSYQGQGIGQADVYIDDNKVGTTSSDGSLLNLNVSPGFHKVVARWNDKSGASSFEAQFDSSLSLTIYLT